MAILNILSFEQTLLKKRSKNIKTITPIERKLIKDMIETMRAAKGVGLAAVQVGVLKRIFVTEIGGELNVFINPRLMERKEIIASREGCLSVPGIEAEISRFNRVKVKALDEKGKSKISETEGLFARAIQHEVDHLDGVLIIDRAEKPEDIHYINDKPQEDL